MRVYVFAVDLLYVLLLECPGAIGAPLPLAREPLDYEGRVHDDIDLVV